MAREQLFSVTHVARDPAHLNGSPPTSSPPPPPFTFTGTSVYSAGLVLNFFGLGTQDLIDTTGGMPFDNSFTIYRGSNNDLALNLRVERVHGDAAAKNYVKQFYQTSGHLKVPLITLHNLLDPEVPYQHEAMYFLLTAFNGNGKFLTQIPVASYGHCNFGENDLLTAFGLLVSKIQQ
jgi:hypothetical protein